MNKNRNKLEIGDLFYIEGLPSHAPCGAGWSDWVRESDGDQTRLFLVLEDHDPGYYYCLDIKRDMEVYLKPKCCNWKKKIS